MNTELRCPLRGQFEYIPAGNFAILHFVRQHHKLQFIVSPCRKPIDYFQICGMIIMYDYVLSTI